MKWRLPQLGLPLVAKELTEQAARKQTYVLRVVYALMLFIAAGVMFGETIAAGSTNLFAILGSGRYMFDELLSLQFWGIYLFMPAMTAGVLTAEKEKNTLGLLFLTRLGPWAIVLEKLLSRVVPMLTFQLLAMPLLAFAYSFGGISLEYVWAGLWVLVLTTLQVGALGVMCSAYFRTTLGALVGTYVIGALLAFGPALVVAAVLFYVAGIQRLSMLERLLELDGPLISITFGPATYARLYDMTRGPLTVGDVLWYTAPLALCGCAFLVLARRFVVSRAFINPINPLVRMFRALDRFFHRINQNRLTRGVVLIREDMSLPQFKPVAWRETKKRSLGRPQWLIRIFLALEAFVCFVAVSAAANYSSGSRTTGHAALLVWLMAIIIVAVGGANMFASERTRQTLDVLLSTPMSTRDIVRQKFSGTLRLCLVLAVPILTMSVIQLWLGPRIEFDLPTLLLKYVSVLVYLPMFAWLACLLGMRSVTQARAVVLTFVLIAAWFTVPYLIVVPAAVFLGFYTPSGISETGLTLMLLSPASMLLDLVYPGFWSGGWRGAAMTPQMSLINLAIYSGFTMLFRSVCMFRADVWLGRAPGVAPPPRKREAPVLPKSEREVVA